MNAPLIVEVTKGATTSQVRVYIGHGVIVTCNDRQVVKSRLTSFMSALGYKLTSEHVQSMSAAPKGRSRSGPSCCPVTGLAVTMPPAAPTDPFRAARVADRDLRGA